MSAFHGLVTGSLYRDAEARTSTGGKEYCRAGIVVHRQDDPNTFVKVTAFGELAAELKHARKGDAVAAAGRLSVETYTGKDGKPAATVVMLVDRLVFLEPPTSRSAEPPAIAPVPPVEVPDSEIPF